MELLGRALLGTKALGMEVLSSKKSNEPAIKVMLVDDHPDRACLVEAELQAQGFEVLSLIPTASGLLFQMEQLKPDVVLIDLESPDRDVLESLSIINNHNPRPVVMFSQEQDPDFISQAVNAGVTAYLCEDINPNKVKPAIDAAMAQFESFQKIRRQLKDTQTQLEDRKIIDRAKGLLMDQHNLSEAKAFEMLRSFSMDSNKSLGESARLVIQMLEKSGTSK